VQIRALSSESDFQKAEALQQLVWPGSEIDVVPAHLMLTIAHHGGLALGAFDGELLAGFVLGFLGTDSESPDRVAMARLKHHSHTMGVHPEYRNQGIGFQLKIAQRELVVEQGIRLITWTFDPLESSNAYLNVRHLGVVCSTYLRNVYGEMRDARNRGIASDRLLVDWWVTSARVNARVARSRSPLDLANYLSAGASKIVSASLDSSGSPRPELAEPIEDATFALIEIPPNYQKIRQEDPELAKQWRNETREALETAFSSGYLVTDFLYLKGEQIPRSYYVLSHGESTLG
jgi:predicted GNAT superfamily acetyltransferase